MVVLRFRSLSVLKSGSGSSPAENLLSDEAGSGAGGLVLVFRPASLRDQDREPHAEERHEQADDGEAAGKHFYFSLNVWENAGMALNRP